MLPIVLHHHEAWNGQGYPHGLKGQETPLLARIVAVADAFDAMTSDRPYRSGMSFEQVEKVFREGAGKQWDPGVVAALFAVRDRVYPIVSDSEYGQSHLSITAQELE
jgi:HD-GYP domain-containing protein (c-di-GMP phosphodiesterase class II)